MLLPVALLAAAGCQRGPLRLASAGLARVGWDSLYVTPSYDGRAGDSLSVFVFAGRDTVLATAPVRSGPLLVHLPDARLPSGAEVLVEVCATAGRETSCVQNGLRASPKRLRSRLVAEYPLGGSPDSVGYRAVWRLERQRARGGGYESLGGVATAPTALDVHVVGAPAASLSVPTTRAADRVGLGGLPGYDAFWLAVNDSAFFGGTARIAVALRSGANVLAADTVTLAPRSAEDRLAEVRRLVQAFERAMGRSLGALAVTAQPTSWRFDRIRRRYEVRVRTVWRDSTGAARALGGTLRMGENGDDARYEAHAVNDSLRGVRTFRFAHLSERTNPSNTTAGDKR